MDRREGDLHGPEDVRRLERARGAGRSRRGTDTETIEMEQNRLALDIFEADITGIGQPVALVTIEERMAMGAVLGGK